MPTTDSGGYTRLRNWTADRDAGVPLSPERFDEDLDDMADAIGERMLRTEATDLLESAAVTSAYDTRAAVAAATVPSTINTIAIAGYRTAGDGGGGRFYRISTPSPVKPYHQRSGDGAYWQLEFTTRVSVRTLGAIGDGVADDTDAIQATIDWLGATDGGVVYFPRGTYKVSLGTLVTSASSADYQLCALKNPYSNVILEGDGVGTSTIKNAVGGVYGVVQMLQAPIENGVTKIFNSGIRDITIDGNYPGATGGTDVGNANILACGTGNCVFDRFESINSSHYGIGLQNGGHVGTKITNGKIANTNQDGIDVKNNESVNAGLVFHALTFSNCGRGINSADPFACMDIDSVGASISDIQVLDFPEDVGATCDAGIRLKQGQEGDSLNRGDGGMRTNVVNVKINRQATATTGVNAFAVNNAWCTLTNCHAVGEYDYGFRMRQPAIISACTADQAVVGFFCDSITGTANAWPYYDAIDSSETGGVYNTLHGVHATNCGTGIKVSRKEVSIISPFLDTCDIGIDYAMSSISGGHVNARFKDCGIDIQANSATVPSIRTMFNNNGPIARFGRTATQYVDVANDTAGAQLNIHSPSSNAKPFRVNVTTDESDTVPSGGALGYFLQMLGIDIVRLTYVASVVNYFDLRASATGGALRVLANGHDTNCDISLEPRGTGWLQVHGSDGIKLGGTTSSEAAIKRSGTTVQTRLADDSAYAAMDALKFLFGGATSSTAALDRSGTTIRARLGDDSAYAAIDALKFLFGGATSGNPALKASSTTIQARLGNDSAYAAMDVLKLLLGGATSGNPAIYASGTTARVRLGDDSGYAPLAAGKVTVAAGTATPAGGSTAAFLQLGSTSGLGIYYGSGVPTISAAKGSLYLRSDGSGINDRQYINTDGATTWTAGVTVA